MSETLINDIFRTAHSEGRSSLFEHEVYSIVQLVGAISRRERSFVPPH